MSFINQFPSNIQFSDTNPNLADSTVVTPASFQELGLPSSQVAKSVDAIPKTTNKCWIPVRFAKREKIEGSVYQPASFKEIDGVGDTYKKYNDYTYMWYPLAIIRSQNDLKYVKQNLLKFAQAGYIIHFPNDRYQKFVREGPHGARGNRQALRSTLKPINAHNDKMGVDFNVGGGHFVFNVVPTPHFKSAYKDALADASTLYQTSNPPLSALFGHMSKEFTYNRPVPTSDQQVAVVNLDTIQGLNMEITSLRQQLDNADGKVYKYKKRSQGQTMLLDNFRGQKLLSPESLSVLPQRIKRNLDILGRNHVNPMELQFQKGLVDASHPSVMGVRVPSLFASETATFYDYQSIEIDAQQFLCLYNHEYAGPDDLLFTTDDTLITNIVQGQSQRVNVVVDGPGHNAGPIPVEGIMFPSTMTGLASKITHSNFNPDAVFASCRTAASCLKLYKTSTADTEQGTLDIHYGRNGCQLQDGHRLITNMGRESNDRARVYLAQDKGGCCRGKVGSMIQNQWRPVDMASFEYQHADGDSGKKNFTRYSGISSAFWWIIAQDNDNNDGNLPRIIPSRDLQDPDQVVGFVADSLNQRHSSVWYARSIGTSMTFTLEKHKHYEGQPDADHTGFASFKTSSLQGGRSTLDIISDISPKGMFAGYQTHRDVLLAEMMRDSQDIKGWQFWTETLFPKIQELMRYGADQLLTEDNATFTVDAIVDAAIAAVMGLAPEALPIVTAAAAAGRPMAHMAAKQGVDQLKTFVDSHFRGAHEEDDYVKGPQKYLPMPPNYPIPKMKQIQQSQVTYDSSDGDQIEDQVYDSEYSD